MNQNSVQYIKAQNVVFNENQSKLSVGSKVFIKVLGNKGNGNFLVSFKGNRFIVKSSLPLVEGQKFYGVIKSFEDNRVLIVPENNANAFEVETGSLSSFLSMNGLEGNSILTGLISFFQQSGLKLDFALIEKAKNIGARFPGKEKACAEIALMLLSKGIEASDDIIEKFLFFLDFDSEKESGNNQQENCDKDESDNKENQLITDYIKASENGLNELILNLYGTSVSDIEIEKVGMFSILNQLKTGDKHWVLLPYEVSFSKTKGKGIIRILINLYNKSIEKIVINYDSGKEKLFFVLYYIGSKVKEVRFCSLPPLLTGRIQEEEKRLGDFIRSGMNECESVPVTYSSSAYVDGFCSSSEDILVEDVIA